jgi:hypothetical protein
MAALIVLYFVDEGSRINIYLERMRCGHESMERNVSSNNRTLFYSKKQVF